LHNAVLAKAVCLVAQWCTARWCIAQGHTVVKVSVANLGSHILGLPKMAQTLVPMMSTIRMKLPIETDAQLGRRSHV